MNGELLLETQVEWDDVLLLDDDSLHSLVEHGLTREHASGNWEVNVRFVSDDTIQDMHREFMDLDSATDILTFPYGDEAMPGMPLEALGGDVVISVDTAASNALDAGWTAEDELRFLVLHGVLHLLGWDDETDEKRASMLARQLELLDSWSGRG